MKFALTINNKRIKFIYFSCFFFIFFICDFRFILIKYKNEKEEVRKLTWEYSLYIYMWNG